MEKQIGCKYYKRNVTSKDNCKLTLHIWEAEISKATLFYIHGMQSHGGWLFETGPYLADKGITVCVLDRRGSGESSGNRGDVVSEEILLEDYKLALKYIKQSYKNKPLTLLGQSLGGSILAGLLAWDKFDLKYDNVIFCAPALGQLHNRLAHEELEKRLSDESDILHDVNLPFEKYSSNKKYIDFMKDDKKCIQKITSRSRKAFLQIENIYYQKNDIIKVPSVFIYPQNDEIIDIKCSKRVYERMCNGGVMLKLAGESHYMEYSKERITLLNWISMFVLYGGSIYESRSIYSQNDNERNI